MKTINLFVDFEFTSLSPDAQIISIGIVSGGTLSIGDKFPVSIFNEDQLDAVCEYFTPEYIEYLGERHGDDIKLGFEIPAEYRTRFSGAMKHAFFWNKHKVNLPIEPPKSFYAEFTCFDINRCDDWVKENVVGKLKYNTYDMFLPEYGVADMSGKGSTSLIKLWLYRYLEQFSDYQIQIVVDCGTFDWYHFLQLVAEWDEVENENGFSGSCPTCGTKGFLSFKNGLPKLHSNISPVPLDLNDLIAFKNGISVREAFDLNREWLANDVNNNINNQVVFASDIVKDIENKHNALFDAKVIKAIYEKIK